MLATADAVACCKMLPAKPLRTKVQAPMELLTPVGKEPAKAAGTRLSKVAWAVRLRAGIFQVTCLYR